MDYARVNGYEVEITRQADIDCYRVLVIALSSLHEDRLNWLYDFIELSDIMNAIEEAADIRDGDCPNWARKVQ